MKSYVNRALLAERKKVEKAIVLVRLAVVAILVASFLALEDNFPRTTLPLILLGSYALVSVVGLVLALANIYRRWLAFVFSTLDIFVLFGFFIALAQIYQLPAREILRLPAATLIFLIIAIAALRHQLWLIVYIVVLYVGAWLTLVLLLGSDQESSPRTGFADLPLQAEYLRLTVFVFVGFITGILVYRTHKLLLKSIIENRQRTNLSKYLPDTLIKNMASEGSNLVEESHCQEAAVLFVDIRGFAEMSENVPPRQVIRFLTEFRHRMTDAIISNGGTIDKFIGDAIMVVFGVPTPDRNDAGNALQCGIGMLDALRVWNEERREQGEQPVKVGIGIHCGKVIAGALGDENRVEYTVIGDAVNVAERLETLTRELETPLVISQPLYDQAKPFSQSLKLTRLKDVTLKGRRGKMDIYELK